MVLAALCALFAVVQFVLALRVRAAIPLLSEIDAPVPQAWPKLSIVVPARNEASGIERALASKLACGYENLEVVVVDDRSTDETGAIAERFAREDARLTVTRVDELPPGWLGKLHAMSVGAARASGDWILLSDADVHVEPGALQRIIAHAEAHDVDFVAVLPQLDARGPILDACMAAVTRSFAVVGRTWSANDDRSSVGVGVGAFNLVRRRALEKTPGLVYLRMEMADDVALGAMLKASGARCRLFAARASVHLAPAETFTDLVRSGEKAGFLLDFSLLKTLGAMCFCLAFDLVIPICAIVAGGPLALLGALSLASITLTNVVVTRHLRAPLRGALLWPIGTLISAALVARAGTLAWWRDAVVWRGTRYAKGDVLAGRRWVGGRVRLTY